MNIDDRMRAVKQAGYLLLSQDDGSGNLRAGPVGHQHLGDARLHPVVAFEALMQLDPTQLQDWML